MVAAASFPIPPAVPDESRTRTRALPVVRDASDPPMRRDCMSAYWPHPCPVTTCRHHIPRVTRRRQKASARQVPSQPDVHCVLAVVAQGPIALEAVASLLGVTRERIRQMETVALRKLQLACKRRGISLDHLIADWADRARG